MTEDLLLKSDIQHSFNKAARTYDAAAFFQKEVADRLLERLDYLKITPKLILDLGSGTGYSALKLEQRYKKSKIVAIDLAEQMLRKAKNNTRWFDRKRYLCADAEKIPLQDNSVDLIFSNLMLHWCNDVNSAIAEMQRVLKPGGLLLFSTLGPDTLYELRDSWSSVDHHEHVHHFIDMHNLGDALHGAHLKDTVMDMEFITVQYSNIKKIFLDLKELGTHNIAPHRNKALTGKHKFKQFISSYEKLRNEEGRLPLTYEVIYGIGWGQIKESGPREFSIPISNIKRNIKTES